MRPTPATAKQPKVTRPHIPGYGMPRGSVPTASTADLSPVPIANQLPVIGVTPLPARSADDEQGTESADGSAADGSDGAPYGSSDASTAGSDQ